MEISTKGTLKITFSEDMLPQNITKIDKSALDIQLDHQTSVKKSL